MGSSVTRRRAAPKAAGGRKNSRRRGKAAAVSAFAGLRAALASLAGLAGGGGVLWLGFYAMRRPGHLEGMFKVSFAALFLCMAVAGVTAARLMLIRRGKTELFRPVLPGFCRLLLTALAMGLLALWHVYLDRVPYGLLWRLGQQGALLKVFAAIVGSLAAYALLAWIALRWPRRR